MSPLLCPHAHCRAAFGDDFFAYGRHLKSCTPKVETDAERDARMLADDSEPTSTPYERRKFEEDRAEFGLDVAARNDAARARRRLAWSKHKTGEG